MNIFGTSYTFDNPVPLYAIALNLSLFFLLRMCHRAVYIGEELSDLRGIIIALYLLVYGNFRMILEEFRTEIPVFNGLTQAQVVMTGFMVTGAAIVLSLLSRYLVILYSDNRENALIRFRRAQSLAGLLLYFALLSLVSWVLLENRVVAWPFHRIDSVLSAYKTILEYAPVALIAGLTLPWLRYSGLPVIRFFTWKKFSPSFFAGIACALLYSLYILHSVRFGIDSPGFWPPVVILSLLNAFSEEIILET